MEVLAGGLPSVGRINNKSFGSNLCFSTLCSLIISIIIYFLRSKQHCNVFCTIILLVALVIHKNSPDRCNK